MVVLVNSTVVSIPVDGVPPVDVGSVGVVGLVCVDRDGVVSEYVTTLVVVSVVGILVVVGVVGVVCVDGDGVVSEYVTTLVVVSVVGILVVVGVVVLVVVDGDGVSD